MPFKISTADKTRVTLTRLDSGCGRFLFIFVGAVFTIIGVALMVFAGDSEMPVAMFAYLFPVFGIIAIIAGIRLPALERRNTPDEIIFDNTQGRVEINQAMSDIRTGYIYYDEIDDFTVKAKKSQSTSTSSSRTSGRTYYTYHVYLVKKDGGEWELLKRNSEKDALAEIVRLKELIDLQATPQRVVQELRSSPKFSVSDYGNKAEIVWKNKLGYAPFFMIGFCALFIAIAYTIFQFFLSEAGDMSFFFYFVAGFIGVVFVLVIGGNTLKMIKNAKTIYAVSVSSSSLDYFERDLAGRISKNIQFPMTDLHALSFSFDTERSLRKIYIYTRDQFRKKQSMQPSLSMSFIREMYEFYRSLVALDLQDLTAVEALAVETYLQQKISRLANTNVA